MNPRQLASDFIARHGGRSNVQGIKLPEGDFLIKANDGQVFSSLTPQHSPAVIELGRGRELYDHGGFIISTVGLKAEDQPWLGGAPHPEARDTVIAPENEIFVAFQNHYDMNAPSLAVLREDYLRTVGGYEDPFLYGMDWDNNWDDHLTQYHGWSDNGDPPTLRRPPDLVQRYAELVNTYGLGDRRIIDDHPSFTLYHTDGSRVLNQPGLQAPAEQPAGWAQRAAIEEAGFERVAVPSGNHYPDFMRSSGILHWEGNNGNMYLDAYRDGKLIVAHPNRLMPVRQHYSRMQGLPFNMNQWGHDVEHPYFPWPENPAIPTLVRTHIYPTSAAHDFVPPVDRTWVPSGRLE